MKSKEQTVRLVTQSEVAYYVIGYGALLYSQTDLVSRNPVVYAGLFALFSALAYVRACNAHDNFSGFGVAQKVNTALNIEVLDQMKCEHLLAVPRGLYKKWGYCLVTSGALLGFLLLGFLWGIQGDIVLFFITACGARILGTALSITSWFFRDWKNNWYISIQKLNVSLLTLDKTPREIYKAHTVLRSQGLICE